MGQVPFMYCVIQVSREAVTGCLEEKSFLLVWHAGPQFPDQGSDLRPLYRKLGVLTAGPSGKSCGTEVLTVTHSGRVRNGNKGDSIFSARDNERPKQCHSSCVVCVQVCVCICVQGFKRARGSGEILGCIISIEKKKGEYKKCFCKTKILFPLILFKR